MKAFIRGHQNRFWLLSFFVVIVLHLLLPQFLNSYDMSIALYAGINMILAMSLNLISGFTGQFSMGHAGFMAIGGYLSSFLSLLLQNTSPDLFASSFSASFIFLGCLIIGGCAAAFAGYLVGLPTLRLRGDYLAIVTLGFGEIIKVILYNIDAVGGARGMPSIPRLTSFIWVYGWVLCTLFVLSRIIQAPLGRGFLSVREDEIASSSMGVDTTKTKVAAFVIGAFFAGVAGGLFAHYLSYLNPSTFDFNKSFDIIIMVVLGGLGSLTGSIIAAGLLTVLKEALRSLQEITHIDFRMVIYSLILILTMILKPDGLFGTRELKDFFPFNGNKKQGSKKPKGSGDLL